MVDHARKMMELLRKQRLVSIIRMDNLDCAVDLSKALLEGGILFQEYTLSNPEALKAIRRVRSNVDAFGGDHAWLGVGSVRYPEQAVEAIEAGVDFIVTPIMVPEVLEIGVAKSCPVFCGAYTPTEIHTAANLGADVVKVFPARGLGSKYLSDVLAPMPELKLMPTGGINLENMASYFEAGAFAVGIGGNLIDGQALANNDWMAVTNLARRYADAAMC